MKTEMHESIALSRRALMAGGAGWVLGAAGLILPASIDGAEARDGALGGRHGQDHRGRDKDHGNPKNHGKDHRTHKKSLKDVEVTFINGTSETIRLNILYNETQHFLAPQERETVTESSTVLGVELLARNDTHYFVSAGNPALGLPHVWIRDEDSNTLVFDERLTEGQQIDSYAFLVTRLNDTADFKVFEITPHDA
jgi:hypothetical protein